MVAPEVIYGTLGGFLAGFGSAAAMMRILINSALAQFKNQLGEGDEGFITRREAHLAFQVRK